MAQRKKYMTSLQVGGERNVEWCNRQFHDNGSSAKKVLKKWLETRKNRELGLNQLSVLG